MPQDKLSVMPIVWDGRMHGCIQDAQFYIRFFPGIDQAVNWFEPGKN
jgi:hypothetical protein